MDSIQFLPIVAAGIASVIVGAVWYDPHVFGTEWMRLTNVTPEMAEKGKKRMPLYIFLGLIAGMIVAYVLNYFGIKWGVSGIYGALELALKVWIGFVVPILLGQVIWDQKPFKLYLINVSYWLVSLVAMSFILLI